MQTLKLGLALCVKKRKVKTSKVNKVSKTSKESKEQKIGVDDICRIRPEDTHGTVCGFATTVTMEPYKSSDSSELRPQCRGQMQFRLSLKTRCNLRR